MPGLKSWNVAVPLASKAPPPPMIALSLGTSTSSVAIVEAALRNHTGLVRVTALACSGRVVGVAGE